MVTDPLGQTEQFAEAGATSVVAHIEASPDPEPVIERARSLGLGVGISLNPPTPLDAVLPYLERVDVLNVMTVNPGWAGQRFIRDMLPKIEAARAEIDRRGLDVAIAVDGGIDLETGRDALDAGANVLGAASAIFSRPDPANERRTPDGGRHPRRRRRSRHPALRRAQPAARRVRGAHRSRRGRGARRRARSRPLPRHPRRDDAEARRLPGVPAPPDGRQDERRVHHHADGEVDVGGQGARADGRSRRLHLEAVRPDGTGRAREDDASSDA